MTTFDRPFGRYLEDFTPGDVLRHWPGKTITEADDHLFCMITMNHHPLHTNAWFAEKSPRTSMACIPSGVSNWTRRPSASSRNNSQWWLASNSCASTLTLTATADGTGSGPVTDQPPPRMYNLPSATWAESARSMVTFTGPA